MLDNNVANLWILWSTRRGGNLYYNSDGVDSGRLSERISGSVDVGACPL